jgi:hypothetical protein
MQWKFFKSLIIADGIIQDKIRVQARARMVACNGTIIQP